LVEQSVSSFKNIEDLTIDEKTGIGEMMLENDSNLREIIKAIDEAGYAVELL
jgi:copper chaperone CopZ